MEYTSRIKLVSAISLLLILLVGCAKETEVIDELPQTREFAPTDLELRIRNQVNVEIKWFARPDVGSYIVDISEEESFGNIVSSVEVTREQLPVLETLQGDTKYYIRVKAISDRGLQDSNYATDTISTESEQLFLPIEAGDILAIEATLRWVPNSEVTQIEVNPGNIVHEITAQEKIDGIAIVMGLEGETEYTAVIKNNDILRGTTSFITEVDASNNVVVTPNDSLFQMVAAANPGAILILQPGDYTGQTGVLVIDKSITIRGLESFNKPLLANISIQIQTGAEDVELIDLNVDGMKDENNFLRYEAPGDYNSLLIQGCHISNYTRSFVSGNATGALIQSITIENCILTDFPSDGGDFIDFRNSNVLNMTIKTSTFNSCAPGRDFLRMDAAGSSSGTGLVSNVLLENCTLYNCASNASRRILYVRFETNEIEVHNTLITDTEVEGYSDRSRTDVDIVFKDNNYFNAPTLYDPTVARFDDLTISNSTTLDPGYMDAANGDFTLTNQTLIDNQVGDPRWY